MELTNERELESGDFEWDIEYTEEEFVAFVTYARTKGLDVENMKEEDIVQFAVLNILKDDIERTKNEQD